MAGSLFFLQQQCLKATAVPLKVLADNYLETFFEAEDHFLAAELPISINYVHNTFAEMSKMTSNRKVSFVDDIPSTSTSSGENVNMDPETAKRLFEIGATLILVTRKLHYKLQLT